MSRRHAFYVGLLIGNVASVLAVLALVVGVVGAWGNLCALAAWLVMLPVRLWRRVWILTSGIWEIVRCHYPWSIRLAQAVDYFGAWLTIPFDDPRRHPRLFTASGVSLTTWLCHPSAGMASYRRHLEPLLEMRARGQLDLLMGA